MHFKYFLRPKGQSSALEADVNLNFLDEYFCSQKAPISTKKVSMFKSPIKENYENDWQLIEAQFTSLD